MQWFRFYSETLNDPKVQNLPPDIFKLWVNCLCLASSSDSHTGNIGKICDVAYALRVTDQAVTSASQTLSPLGLLVTSQGQVIIPKWSKRQFKSDSSKDRTRKWRERHRDCPVTAPESETEQNRTEQIQRNVTEQKNVINGYHHNGGKQPMNDLQTKLRRAGLPMADIALFATAEERPAPDGVTIVCINEFQRQQIITRCSPVLTEFYPKWTTELKLHS
jgi:hypothetical protein